MFKKKNRKTMASFSILPMVIVGSLTLTPLDNIIDSIHQKFAPSQSVTSMAHTLGPLTLNVTQFQTAGGSYKVAGYVENTGDAPYRFVLIKAEFYDQQGKLAGVEMNYVSGPQYIRPGERKAFELSGRDPGNFATVRVEIKRFRQ